MKLQSTPIDDLFVLERPIRSDQRGYFARLYGKDELEAAGRSTEAFHVNSSMSMKKGTLRGIHFQYPPFAEEKIVSCITGRLWDVAVDLRPKSKTQFEWYGVELTPTNGKSLIIPRGFGHAFITLEEQTTVLYVVSTQYNVEFESGARFDDPLLNINYPLAPAVLSDKDKNWASLESRLSEITERFANLAS